MLIYTIVKFDFKIIFQNKSIHFVYDRTVIGHNELSMSDIK